MEINGGEIARREQFCDLSEFWEDFSFQGSVSAA